MKNSTPSISSTPFLDTFFVLDFDRTLGNTDKLHGVLERVVEQKTGIPAHRLLDAKLAAEAIGQPFDTASYAARLLTEMGTPVTPDELLKDFIASASAHDMLEPRARELLALLDEADMPYGILTHGKKRWQSAKLAASGLINVPHIITDLKEKGRILSSWQKDGRFEISVELWPERTDRTVEAIVFLDDKAVSFHHLPTGVRGIRVRPLSVKLLLPAQEGALPKSVEEVEGIAGAIKLLFGK